MSDTIVQPVPGQPLVVTTHDKHRGDNDRGHRGEWDLLREMSQGFRDVARETAQSRVESTRDIKDTRFDITKSVTDAASAAALAACKIGDQVAEGSKEAAVAAKDQLVTAYQVEGRALLEAAKNAAALGVQAEKLAAAAILDATKNAAAIAAQLAECCCELKEKIGTDGNSTRDLINSIERNRLSVLLSAAYTRNVPPVTPV